MNPAPGLLVIICHQQNLISVGSTFKVELLFLKKGKQTKKKTKTKKRRGANSRKTACKCAPLT